LGQSWECPDMESLFLVRRGVNSRFEERESRSG
jgi:hypothetical protein